MEAPEIRLNSPSGLKESEIIKRILAGEKEQYEILMRRNNQGLYRVIRSYIANENDVEDIMQITYIKAYENLSKFKLMSKFSTWLISIGIRECLSSLKKISKAQNMHLSIHNPVHVKIIEMPDNNLTNPEKNIIHNEAKIMLENAIDKLPQEYRTIYVLGEVNKMGMKEIAESTGLTLSNVKVRLHRARIMIKDSLFKLTTTDDVFEFGNSKCDNLVLKVLQRIL